MNVERFMEMLGADFYTGVPDSQLKALCDCLLHTYGTDPQHHIIAANEGNCAAIAAGYHLATGRVPVVYMQNSGEGNLINPAASLLSEQVYAIPLIFVIGWRGEPGVHDEPQHIYQGAVTLRLLEDMDIAYYIVDKQTTEDALAAAMADFRAVLAEGKQVAFVVRKGALTCETPAKYENAYPMRRETAIQLIAEAAGDDILVSTTGKASRELFELREAAGQGHSRDFLTVGSMGHASSIALGAALQRPNKRFWVIDGDGAALMHMGALAVIGTQKPRNLVHIIINNGAHESVGGMPTAAAELSLAEIARACGYPHTACVTDEAALRAALDAAKACGTLSLIEVKCAVGARADLGRPTASPQENKRALMEELGTQNA